MFENALYYPTIDIGNDAWLKTAALFWDRIETIVPESEDRPYQKRNTRMLQDEGILFAHRINPFCEEVRGIEEDVLKFVNTPEGKKSFTRPWGYSRANGRHGEDFHADAMRQTYREHQEKRLRERYKDFYIHVEKLPMILRERLDIEEDEDGYVWASRGFLSFYMTLLANRISQNNRLSLLTDRVNQNNLSNKILTEGLLPSGKKVSEKLIKRGMMYQVIMDDIKIDSHTPMETIVKYKRERCYELDAFRREMDRLTAFDTDGMNVKDLEHEIWSIYTKQVKPAIDGVKATLKDSGINWWSGLGTCVFTGLLPAVLGFGTDMKTNIAIGVSECLGLALTTVPYVRKRMEVSGNPYSYLVKLDRQLSVSWRSENRVV